MKRLLFITLILVYQSGFCQLTALDSSFGNAGITTITGGSYPVGTKILDDGKILILISLNGNISLVRLMPDGSIDTGFISQTLSISTSFTPRDMVVQSDGKIVAVVQNYNDTSLVRLNTDGTIDTSFGNNGYVMNCFQSQPSPAYNANIAYDSLTGNIYISDSRYSNSLSQYSETIESYTSTGLLNTSFNGVGFRTWTSSRIMRIYDLAVDSAGKIVSVGFSGYSSNYGNGSASDSLMRRLNNDGSLDTTFSGDGIFNVRQGSYFSPNFDFSSSVYFKVDGSIVVTGTGGEYLNKRFMLYEVTNIGNLISNSMPYFFSPVNYEDSAFHLVRDNDGKYILGGQAGGPTLDTGGFGILRINPDYTVDTPFGINGWIACSNQSYNYFLYGLAVQPDNKILALGRNINPSRIMIARYLNTTTLNTEDFVKKNPVVLSPNPSSDVLNITVNDISFLNTAYKFVDINGRIISDRILSTSVSEINVEGLSKGIYFIKFENQNLVQKFVKQ